jgi:hypothetical protein
MPTASTLVQIHAVGNKSSAPNEVIAIAIAIANANVIANVIAIKAIQDPQVSRRTTKETLKLPAWRRKKCFIMHA